MNTLAEPRFDDKVLEEYVVDTLGLPYPIVVRGAVVERRDRASGEVLGHRIPDLDGLIAAVAVMRALVPVRLSGPELRFMRKATALGSAEFAEAVGLNPSSYSRYENDKDEMGGFVEQIVREKICEELKDQAPAIDYEPKKIIGMRMLREWEGEPRFIFERITFKDGSTRQKSCEWDAELPLAA